MVVSASHLLYVRDLTEYSFRKLIQSEVGFFLVGQLCVKRLNLGSLRLQFALTSYFFVSACWLVGCYTYVCVCVACAGGFPVCCCLLWIES